MNQSFPVQFSGVGGDINQKDKYGQSPLKVTILSKFEKIEAILRKHGAED